MTTENYTGINCTGNEGETNRTLTIGNTLETSNDNFEVFVNNSFLHLSIDYTVNHNESGTVITFLNNLWNNQNITVIYTTEVSRISTGDSGVLPLDTQYINNEITYFGDSITIRNKTNLSYDNYGNSQEVLGDSKISYTSGDDALLGFYDSTWVAQTFSVGDSDISVTSIKIYVKRTGTPGEITISIKAIDEDSKPTGDDLTSGSLTYNDLITDGSTEWIVLPLTSYTLSANTTYSLVIRTNSGDSSNKFEARIKTTGTYSGGNSLTSSDSGSTWTSGSSDILFDLYGDTETVAIVDILSQNDDAVKNGQFQSGDKRFFLQNSETISRGSRIKHNNLWYEVKELITDSCTDDTYFIECLGKKV